MTRILFIAVTLLVVGVHGALIAQERGRVGRAYDANSGALLYEERHDETVVDGAMIADSVSYLDSQGVVFAHKQVDFRDHLFAPEFRLDNERTGHLEALRRESNGGIALQFREQATRELRETRLANTPNDAVADAGFDRFIAAHWDDLAVGARLVRRFLVPSRLEFMDFRVRRSDDDSNPREVSFAVEIDSAFLRLVVPPITVVYDRDTRRLLRYEGLSNLRDENGDNLAVRIEFEYVTRNARAVDEPVVVPRDRAVSKAQSNAASPRS